MALYVIALTFAYEIAVITAIISCLVGISIIVIPLIKQLFDIGNNTEV